MMKMENLFTSGAVKKTLLLALIFVLGTGMDARTDRDTYTNPVICLDYSDPDVVRTGNDYWMTASSFNCIPGLPILHSTDLVHWEIVNYALDSLVPEEHYSMVQHGKGVWAPCIKFHDGWYYIYWGDPDFGIFMVKTQDPRGKWSEPVLVKAGTGKGRERTDRPFSAVG